MDSQKDIHSYVVKPASLSRRVREEMFQLMCNYFDDLNRDVFERDLNEKQWVICLAQRGTGRICGFSTLCLIKTTLGDRSIHAFFSGDTIIHRNCRGSLLLEKEWLRLVFKKVRDDPSTEWYWFLISKGYRTYRYLPVYFHRYYPAPGSDGDSAEKEVLDHLGYLRFGDRYDAESGIIQCSCDYRLKPGVSDISEELLKDLRIAFFQKKNPGWLKGDELACLVRLEEGNLRRSFRKEVAE